MKHLNPEVIKGEFVKRLMYMVTAENIYVGLFVGLTGNAFVYSVDLGADELIECTKGNITNMFERYNKYAI